MSATKEELYIERRIQEIHEITQKEGWKHVEDIFRDQISDLTSIHSLEKYPKEQKLDMMQVHSEVATRLQAVLEIVNATATQYAQQSVDEVRVYGESDFGHDDIME